MNDETQAGAKGNEEKKVAHPQKIYLKDVSFESPNAPDIFTSEWKPKLEVEIDSRTKAVAEDTYDVVMKLTATVTVEDKTAFLVEVQQAGIFTLQGFDQDGLQNLLNVFCPRTLYPYACAALNDIVGKGGFPQLPLAPINFDAQYRQRLQQAAQADETTQVQH